MVHDKFVVKGIQTRISFPPQNAVLPTHFRFFCRISPQRGCWRGTVFDFEVAVPSNFPFVPPNLCYMGSTPHPKLCPRTGRVSFFLVDKEWKPVLTLNTVVFGLQLMFVDPHESVGCLAWCSAGATQAAGVCGKRYARPNDACGPFPKRNRLTFSRGRKRGRQEEPEQSESRSSIRACRTSYKWNLLQRVYPQGSKLAVSMPAQLSFETVLPPVRPVSLPRSGSGWNARSSEKRLRVETSCAQEALATSSHPIVWDVDMA